METACSNAGGSAAMAPDGTTATADGVADKIDAGEAVTALYNNFRALSSYCEASRRTATKSRIVKAIKLEPP